MDIYSIVITVISGVGFPILVHMLKTKITENRELQKEKAERDNQRETALETGVRQLLSVKLEEMYDKYAESPTIPKRAYTRWMKLHDAYKGLHGNGTFNHMKEELEEKHIVNG